jgi:hypothetical protein
VNRKVCLTIAVEIQLAQSDPAFYRLFKYARSHVQSSPHHFARQANVQ